MNWFECKVRHDKPIENGMMKKVTDAFLVDALSFTEAEARIIEEVTPYISGDFEVTDIKKAKYSEIFFNEGGDSWYKSKLMFITIDEKSGVEKKSAINMLVQASDLREAVQNLDKGMKGTMADYEIASIAETNLMDIFPFNAEGKPAKESE